MKRTFLKLIFFFIITNIQFVILSTHAKADTNLNKEMFLKTTNDKILRFLKDSNEARIYLDDDLIPASEILQKSTLRWKNTVSEIPVLYPTENGYELWLSQFYSFKSTTENQLSTVLSILYHIQRQLNLSIAPLPQARMRIFSKKFSGWILKGTESCTFSPLSFKKEFIEVSELKDVVSEILKKKKFSRNSQSEYGLWIGTSLKSDAGCNGNNRNILNIEIKLIHISSLETLYSSSESYTSCKPITAIPKELIQKVSKKIKKDLADCNNTIGI